ncbi:hypothetical protein ABIB57_004656 [Devosia sp. UYZn731]
MTITITPPPDHKREVSALRAELAYWRTLIPQCPNDAPTMLTHVAVEGLRIVEGEDGPHFQVAP